MSYPYSSPVAPDGRGTARPRDGQGPRRREHFDIVEWHRSHRSCQRFFLDHGQHEEGTHALTAFVNIKLPCQWLVRPIYSSNSAVYGPDGNPSGYFPRPINPSDASNARAPHVEVSLRPYVRRLVVTGFGISNIFHGLFGDDWPAGVGPIVEEERRNYLFAAKASDWESIKAHYDMGDGQTVPRLTPLDDATEAEIQRAEREWSSWILMQDWLVGSRRPENEPR